MERLEPALRTSVDRVTGLVSAAPNVGVRVPRAEWTGLDVLSHLVTVTPRYARWPGADRSRWFGRRSSRS